jgi:hypothetical protein
MPMLLDFTNRKFPYHDIAVVGKWPDQSRPVSYCVVCDAPIEEALKLRGRMHPAFFCWVATARMASSVTTEGDRKFGQSFLCRSPAASGQAGHPKALNSSITLESEKSHGKTQ